MTKTILVCGNHSDSREIVSLLRQDQHVVDVVTNLIDQSDIEIFSYDLVILDSRNDFGDKVIDECRNYRAAGIRAAIVVVVAEEDPAREASILDAGADDCLFSGFCGPELPARIRALIRRRHEGHAAVLKIQDVEIDCSALRVTRAGEEISLTRKEFEILSLLMRYPNKSFTPDSILKRVWTPSSCSSVATVRTHMKTLRKKIGDARDQRVIKTTRGWGYKVVDSVSVDSEFAEAGFQTATPVFSHYPV